jgi:Fic family protein
MLFQTPGLDLEDDSVLDEIHGLRTELASVLRIPRRWDGGLRRSMLARAIQGSNSIEGYDVELDDAAAALDDEEPLSADHETFAEIRGYRQALGYVLAMAEDAEFGLDASVVRSMHYMMLGHDLTKSPGSYRRGTIYVRDDVHDRNVYEGPPAADVPRMVEELVRELGSADAVDPLVRAAMAHLNLVMIHPFRDGNGRMARALQTLVLSRGGIGEPAFSSIEEWLGHNTDDYYSVLAVTGGGGWHPERDAGLWVKFNLRAHHMQAQTVARRYAEASEVWTALDASIAENGLPERVADELFDASIGFRIRRSTYVRRAQVDVRTASRDLLRMTELELLRAVGQTRARHYVAGPALIALRRDVVGRRVPVTDPYPWLRGRLSDVATAMASGVP